MKYSMVRVFSASFGDQESRDINVTSLAYCIQQTNKLVEGCLQQWESRLLWDPGIKVMAADLSNSFLYGKNIERTMIKAGSEFGDLELERKIACVWNMEYGVVHFRELSSVEYDHDEEEEEDDEDESRRRRKRRKICYQHLFLVTKSYVFVSESCR
jgi:hypothetical protein